MPRHVAVIMDGNGRWAKKRLLPRVAGHVKGVELVREMVRACLERGIGYLTLFAFSSENWRRPQDEVTLLMQLFVKALEQEVQKLDRNGVPYSDKLTAVEKIRRVGPTRLEIEMTLTDPEAFEEPFTIRRAYVPMPAGSRFEEYVCEYNPEG